MRSKLGFIIITTILIMGCFETETTIRETHIQKDKLPVEKMIVWQNSTEQVIEVETHEYSEIEDILITTLYKLNLPTVCTLREEDIKVLKTNNRVVEIVFERPVNLTIGEWVEPEQRTNIPVNGNGYRVLENIKFALFIIGGSQEGNVYIGIEKNEKIRYICWVIETRENLKAGLDKSWVNELIKVI